MAVSNLAVVVHGDVHVGYKYLWYREFIQQSATYELHFLSVSCQGYETLKK